MSAWELVFLGTGSAYPSPNRGASCLVLRTEQVGCWMFDCGEGSQVQLMRSSLRPSRLNKIFITHLHGDHMFGLPGLLCTISQSSSEERPPLELYGPHGLRQFLRVSLNLSRSQLNFKYMVHELLLPELSPGDIDGMSEWSPEHCATGSPHPQELHGRDIYKNNEGAWEVCGEGALTVSAATLRHRVLTFGYVITEDPLPGRLLVAKLKELGVPPGPLYAKIKKGDTITTASGKEISPSEVTGPPRPGRKVVILGDTRDSSDMIPLALNPDVLVHEATNENAHEAKCRQNGHSTPAMAAEFSKVVSAQQLILTHFSQRYKKEGEPLGQGEESVEKLLFEAKEALARTNTTCTVSVAEDLRVFSVPARK